MDITLPFRHKKLGYAALNVTDLSRSLQVLRGNRRAGGRAQRRQGGIPPMQS
ncbi:hypothetical protein ACTMU2_15720 [Cupriavidus basilensis]